MPRLNSVFTEALERPVTLVVAGAGFGKTTNVADFLHESSTRAVWLTVDVLDQEETRLIDYLIEGFRRLTGIESWESADRPSELGAAALADLFINDLQERVFGRTVLVIDEFDHIAREKGRTLQFFSRIVNYLPDSVRLWILSRRDPPLAAQKLRSAGVIKTLDEELLRWGADEVRTLAKMLGSALGSDEGEAIAQMTAGRAATIRIILESLAARKLSQKKLTELLRNPTLELRRYIEEEVLTASTPELRSTLVRIAIPEEIDVSVLGEALGIPDVDSQVDRLQRETSLLRATATPGVFRLDAMVRSVLVRMAKEELGADSIRRIQHSLGEAYLRRNEVVFAVPALLEAHEAVRAASALIERGEKMMAEGKSAMLRELCELLPSEVVERDPKLLHFYSRALLVEGRFAEAAEKYQILSRKKDAPKELLAWAFQGLCEAAYRRNRMDDARKFATKIQTLFNSADPFARAKILNDLAILELRSGRYDAAQEKWERALSLSFGPAVPADYHKIILHNLGLPTAATGQISAAKSYFERLITPGAEPQKSQEVVAHLNLARIELMKGNLAPAERHLELSMTACEKFNLQSFLRGETMEVFAWLFRKRGEYDRSQLALDAAAAIYVEGKVDPALKELIDEQANLELDRGNVPQALALATSLIQRRREAGNELSLATPLLTLAKVKIRQAAAKEAKETLLEAEQISRRWNMRYQLAETLSLLAQVEKKSERSAKYREEAEELIADEGYAFSTAPVVVAAPAIVVESRADLSAQLLGPPQIHADLGEASWPLKKALGIFCYLATAPAFSASKDQLVDTFWGEDEFDVIERNFHPTLSFLRRSLRAVTSAGKNFIQFANGRYRLDPRYQYDIDVHQFTQSIERASRAIRERREEEATHAFNEAMDLCRGPYMDGFYESWVMSRRTQIGEDLRRVGLQIAHVLIDAGHADDVLRITQKLLENDPFDEMSAQMEMKARALQGDFAGLKALYHRFQETLRSELGEKPSSATQKLYEHLASQT